MKTKRILSFFLIALMILGTLNIEVFAEMGTVVAKIGNDSFTTLAEAITAANAMSGEVTVEIYGKAEYTAQTSDLTGTYDVINFVGKDEKAEISITRNGSNGYISGSLQANDCTVNFTDLILSKPEGRFAPDAGFMNVAFSVYRVGAVNYTNCHFANGSCASGSATTYTKCTFKKSNDKYGLWAYGADVVVDNCDFDDYRGIKMYAEGAAKTTALTVKNTDFSAVDNKPAIVLTYGESVTLENNTYSSTGVFELDKDGSPNGTIVASDKPEEITCVNDDGACGVLVDGKIYSTVAAAAVVAVPGSKVTLLADTTETVELPAGVEFDANGKVAESVTVAEPTGVSSYGDLVSLLAEGKAVKLTDNIIAEGVIDATNAHIDLNSFTLTLADDANNNFFGSSTISNGTISIDGVEVAGDCIIGIGDRSHPSTLNLVDVNLTGSDYSSAFAVLMVYTDGTLNVTGGEWELSGEKGAAGGVIKNQNGAGNNGTINITDTVMVFNNISRGISGGTVLLDEVDMTITGGDNGINGVALTVKDSTLNISGGTGRALTVTDFDVVIENSTLNFSNNAEADIRFKTANKITLDETSELSGCKAFADTSAAGAEINGNAIIGTEEYQSTVEISEGTVTITNHPTIAQIGERHFFNLDDAFDALSANDTLIIKEGVYWMNKGGDENTRQAVYTLPDSVTIIGEGTVTMWKEPVITASGLTVKNIEFIADNESAVRINATGNVNFINCDFTGAEGSHKAIYTEGTGKVTIDGGVLSGDSSFECEVSVTGANFTEDITFSDGATLENCVFTSGYSVKAGGGTTGKTISYKNCRVSDGTDIMNVIGDEHTIKNCTVKVDGVTVTWPENGAQPDGSILNPYIISTLAELQEFATEVNCGNSYAGKYIKLTADIDFAEVDNWTPIGTASNPFKGNFIGDNKTISNLKVSGTDYAGLFGKTAEGKLSGINIVNADVTGTKYIAALVGMGYTGVIENCHISGDINVAGNYMLGGISGQGYAKIYSCSVIGNENNDNQILATYSEADLEGDNVGGIVGHHAEGGTIDGCRVENITITGTRKIGGIAGTAFRNNNITNCVVNNITVATNATEEYASANAGSMGIGGIIGLTSQDYTGGIISGCSVSELVFEIPEELTTPVSAGAITGGHRGSGTPPVSPEGTTITDNNIDMDTVEGNTTAFLSDYKQLSFDTNGGSVMESVWKTVGEVDLSVYVPVKAGYSFGGWYAEAELLNKITTINLTDNATIYAKWNVSAISGGGSNVTNYTITFNTNGGSAIKKVVKNKKATIDLANYIPKKEGYIFEGWYSDKELTNRLTSIKLTENVTVYAKWAEIDDNDTDNTEIPDSTGWKNPFADVSADSWYYESVRYAEENKLMNGTSENTFSPNSTLTRAMLVTVLYRLEGEPATNKSIPFGDVDMGVYYGSAVSWAKQNGIVSGITETEFAPDQNISREQIAAIIYRYAQYKGYDVSSGVNVEIANYDDCGEVSQYAISAIKYAVASGVLKGKTDRTLNPRDNATRAEIATILQRFIEMNKD